MLESQFILHEDSLAAIQHVIDGLVADAGARSVFVVDKTGQLVAQAGALDGLDSTSLASLTAGCVAASEGLARLLGEKEFPHHFHQGEDESLHMTRVGHRGILVVVFGLQVPLGLVRLRVRRASGELAAVLEDARKKSDTGGAGKSSAFSEITDDEIDNLFPDE